MRSSPTENSHKNNSSNKDTSSSYGSSPFSSLRRTEGLLHIVIVGAGFGGLAAARALRKAKANITVIDRRNHHLFQPLLYQVATAGLSPAQIAAPIRGILSGCGNCEVFLDEVVEIRRQEKTLVTKGGQQFTYDFLIIATGAQTTYFGHDEWEKWAPSLKSVEDATEIRRRILRVFELSETESNPQRQDQLLNFVIVGGGPTGVELAGTIAELAKTTLAKDFRHIDPARAQVFLIEAGPRLLSAFPEDLATAAQKKLESMGVKVFLGQRVVNINEAGVDTDQQHIPSQSVIWAAGVVASPAGRWLKAACDKRGRVIVNERLQLPDDDCVFVIGDAALAKDFRTGEPLPGVAPVAMQQGRYVAKVIDYKIKGNGDAPSRFEYFDKGTMATVGRSYAVALISGLKFKGLIAWLLWSFVHVAYLIGFRNRLLVLIEWIWAYFTFQRGARLIVGNPHTEIYRDKVLFGSSPATTGGHSTPEEDFATSKRSSHDAKSSD